MIGVQRHGIWNNVGRMQRIAVTAAHIASNTPAHRPQTEIKSDFPEGRRNPKPEVRVPVLLTINQSLYESNISGASPVQ